MVSTLPVDLFPDTDLPVIFTRTTYEGAGAEEVESELTELLEAQFFTLEGLESMTSTSSEGSSSILLEFEYGTDLEAIKNDMRDKIDRIANSLPDDAGEPIMMEFDPNSQPILSISVQGDRTIEEIYDIAEELIQPRLEQVPDVSNVELTGGRDRIVSVTVAKNRLDAFGLSMTAVGSALSTQNLTLGAGSAETGGKEYQIRTTGTYETIDQIGNTLITTVTSDGEKHKVYLRDIADISFASEEESSRVYLNGLPSVQIQTYKKTGSNTIDVAANIKTALTKVETELPDGITTLITSDESSTISDSLSSVMTSAGLGILSAVFILLVFLRQIKSTLIIAITIPVSILITVMGMSLGDLLLIWLPLPVLPWV